MVYDGVYVPVLKTLLGRLYTDPWPLTFKEQKILGGEVYAAHGYHTPVPEALLTCKKMFMKNLRSGIVPPWVASDAMLKLRFWAVVEKIPDNEKSSRSSFSLGICKVSYVTPAVKKEPECGEPRPKKSRSNHYTAPAIEKPVIPKSSTELIVQKIVSGVETKLDDLRLNICRIETKRLWEKDMSSRLNNITEVEQFRQRAAQQKQQIELNQLAIKQKTDILEVLKKTRRTNEKTITHNRQMIHYLRGDLLATKTGVRCPLKKTNCNNNFKKPASHSRSEDSTH